MEGKFAERGGMISTVLSPLFPLLLALVMVGRERRRREGGGREDAATGPYCLRVEGERTGEMTVAVAEEESDA